MGSRILAISSRLRDWSEALGLLEDNQHGLRPGRSTADAAQVLIRINEELKVLDPATENNRPKAILLDIK